MTSILSFTNENFMFCLCRLWNDVCMSHGLYMLFDFPHFNMNQKSFWLSSAFNLHLINFLFEVIFPVHIQQFPTPFKAKNVENSIVLNQSMHLHKQIFDKAQRNQAVFGISDIHLFKCVLGCLETIWRNFFLMIKGMF